MTLPSWLTNPFKRKPKPVVTTSGGGGSWGDSYHPPTPAPLKESDPNFIGPRRLIGPPKPKNLNLNLGGGGGGYSVPDYVSQLAAQRKSSDDAIARLMEGVGRPEDFQDRQFDESGARSESEAIFNPEFDRLRKLQGETTALDTRGTNEELQRSISELAQLRGSNVINQATQARRLGDNLGAGNIGRSGIGQRDANLGTISGIQENEGVDRQEGNANQINKFALSRIANTNKNNMFDIDRRNKNTISDEIDKRQNKFQSAEDKRRYDYSNDYFRALTSAQNQVYGK